MPKANLSVNLGQALAIDAVDQFSNRVSSLFSLLDSFNVVPVAQGSVVKTYDSVTITKPSGTVAAGAEIPYTKVDFGEPTLHPMVLNKELVGVSAEDIQKFGVEQAIIRKNQEIVNNSQKDIRDAFIDSLADGTGSATGDNFQKAIANATAEVRIVFDNDDPEVVTFVNPRDVAKYLGEASITTQSVFGLQYIENFMDNKIVFQHASIPEGTIYSTAINNLNLYYVDMLNGDLGASFGLEVDESGLIGIGSGINLSRAVQDVLYMYSILMLPERLDGVIVGTIGEGDIEG